MTLLRSEGIGDADPSLAPFRLGVAHFGQGHPARARRAFAAAIAKGGRAAVWAAQQFVQTHLQRGDATRAETELGELLDGRPYLNDATLGYLYRRTWRLRRARDLLERASHSPHTEHAAQLEIAGLDVASGRPDGVAPRLEQVLEQLSAAGDDWAFAAAVTQQAALAVAGQAVDDAVVTCDHATELKRRAGDRLGLGYALQLKAKALYRNADYPAALEVLSEALDVHQRAGHLLEGAVILNNIGLWHLDLADPQWAVEAFRAARGPFRRLGDRRGQAAVLANLGSASRQAGDPTQAVGSLSAALKLLEHRDHAEVRGAVLAELAEALTEAGSAADALARLDRDSRRSEACSTYTRLALEVARGRALLACARPRLALTAARRARSLSRQLTGPRKGLLGARLSAATLLGRSLLATGARYRAIAVLRAAVRYLEELASAQASATARVGVVESYREAHDLLVRAFVSGGRGAAGTAWRFATGLKALELRGDHEGRADGHPTAASERAEARLETTIQRLIGCDASPPTGGDLRRLRQRFVEAHGARPRRAPSIAQRAPLPRSLRCVVFEYHVAPETTWLFVVSDGRVAALDLGLTQRRLEGLLRRLLRPLHATGASEAPREELQSFSLEAAQRLYRALLAPGFEQLDQEAHLAIVPDGALHALPFELLVTRSRKRWPSHLSPLARFDEPVYVNDVHSLSYAPSSLAIGESAAPARPRTLLAIGYSPPGGATLNTPDGPRPLPELPAIERELAAVRSQFGSSRHLSGRRATRANYRRAAARSDVIHIAAHAWSDPMAPALSGVALAPDDDAPAIGYLTAEAIRRTPTSASLVTLSACSTGLAAVRSHEGALSLGRAFLEAGSKSVLASLWPVDDTATRLLMEAFYAGLMGGAEPRQALAAAKRELRNLRHRHLFPERAHPYFWASFVLTEASW